MTYESCGRLEARPGQDVCRPLLAGGAKSRLSGRVRRRLLGISLDEVRVARRGFHAGSAEMGARIERVGRTFLTGYHAALEADNAETLAVRLDMVEDEWRGFAYEGAAMGLTLLDRIMPWRRNRLGELLRGAGQAHVYMLHVGVGWAFARIGLNLERWLNRFDPLLRWLIVDGYGFHDGYFHWRRSIERMSVPRGVRGYAGRAFDQGLGRSLWFVEGGDIERMATTVGRFAAERRADLWSGVGLACGYAGGAARPALESLREAAGAHAAALAQGTAFAAKARQRAGNMGAHTELACEVLCGMSADEAAGVTDAALDDLAAGDLETSYEVWRRRIQTRLADRRSRTSASAASADRQGKS